MWWRKLHKDGEVVIENPLMRKYIYKRLEREGIKFNSVKIKCGNRRLSRRFEFSINQKRYTGFLVKGKIHPESIYICLESWKMSGFEPNTSDGEPITKEMIDTLYDSTVGYDEKYKLVKRMWNVWDSDVPGMTGMWKGCFFGISLGLIKWVAKIILITDEE